MSWQSDLARIRQKAAEQNGLSEYPAALVAAPEHLDRTLDLPLFDRARSARVEHARSEYRRELTTLRGASC